MGNNYPNAYFMRSSHCTITTCVVLPHHGFVVIYCGGKLTCRKISYQGPSPTLSPKLMLKRLPFYLQTANDLTQQTMRPITTVNSPPTTNNSLTLRRVTKTTTTACRASRIQIQNSQVITERASERNVYIKDVYISKSLLLHLYFAADEMRLSLPPPFISPSPSLCPHHHPSTYTDESTKS